ncbi:unnamed protein product [Caenorhabditis sp. 36 PRJEB53466]|nr:unnamed protein product [Caenorhabditis sp. 36 PRJEB53466]
MSGYNDVDLYITMHATFNGAYLHGALQQLVDVPPDPGPPRSNTAILPVETTFGGTRIKINQNTYLQITTVGDVDLNRVDNHITLRPPVLDRPNVFFNRMEDRVQQWQEPWIRRMREHINERERRVAAAARDNNVMVQELQAVGVNYVPQLGVHHNFPAIQNPYAIFHPPVVEMRNMNINRRQNEHDRRDEDGESEQDD